MLLALKKSTCLSRSHRLLQQSTCIGVKTMNIKYIWYINNISQYIPIYKHHKKPLLLPICWRRFTLLCVVNRLLYAIIHPAWLSRLISSAFRNGGSKKGWNFCAMQKGVENALGRSYDLPFTFATICIRLLFSFFLPYRLRSKRRPDDITRAPQARIKPFSTWQKREE